MIKAIVFQPLYQSDVGYGAIVKSLSLSVVYTLAIFKYQTFLRELMAIWNLLNSSR